MKGRGGMELINPGRPALAHGRVRFAGDAVALIVAESAVAAQDAAELVAIEYRDLPAVVSTADALAPGAPQVHDAVPGNLVLDYESGDEAGAREAFERAARVVKMDVHISRVVGNPMEPRACLAAFVSDQYHLYTCTQGVAIMRNQLSAVLGVPPEKIRVIAEEVGGGFGVRFNLYPEYCAALFAAKKLGRPVKWTGTRSEVFLADEQARDVRSHGELALDGSGRILGMRFDMVANLGAYLAPTGPFINTIGIVNCLSGVYDVPATYARIRLALTNTAPMAAYRGAGRPIMSYALERLVDQAARELGMDPAEFRRRNFIPKDKFPYKIAAGFEYDCGDFAGVMDKALSSSGWNDFSKAKGRIGRNAANCAAAASPPTSRPPARASRRRTRSSCAGSDDGSDHRLRADAQPRPGPRDHVRAAALGRARHAARIVPPAHRGPGVLHRRQRHRRLALAARGGQRGDARRPGDGEARPGARRRAARGRARRTSSS